MFGVNLKYCNLFWLSFTLTAITAYFSTETNLMQLCFTANAKCFKKILLKKSAFSWES